jgi:hypothetical protein
MASAPTKNAGIVAPFMWKQIVVPFSIRWTLVGMGFEQRPQLPPAGVLLTVCTVIVSTSRLRD